MHVGAAVAGEVHAVAGQAITETAQLRFARRLIARAVIHIGIIGGVRQATDHVLAAIHHDVAAGDVVRPDRGGRGAIGHRQPVGVEHAVAGGHAVDGNVVVQRYLDFGIVVAAGFGHADVAVALEGHLAVRPNVVAVAVGIGHGPAGVGRIADIVQLIDVDRVGPVYPRSHIGDGLITGIDAAVSNARPTSNRYAAAINRGIAGLQAVGCEVVGQIEGDVVIRIGLGDLDVVVGVAQVDAVAWPDIALIRFLSCQAPAFVGRGVHVLQLTQIDRIVGILAVGDAADATAVVLVDGHVAELRRLGQLQLDGPGRRVGDRLEIIAAVTAGGVGTAGNRQRLAQVAMHIAAFVAGEVQALGGQIAVLALQLADIDRVGIIRAGLDVGDLVVTRIDAAGGHAGSAGNLHAAGTVVGAVGAVGDAGAGRGHLGDVAAAVVGGHLVELDLGVRGVGDGAAVALDIQIGAGIERSSIARVDGLGTVGTGCFQLPTGTGDGNRVVDGILTGAANVGGGQVAGRIVVAGVAADHIGRTVAGLGNDVVGGVELAAVHRIAAGAAHLAVGDVGDLLAIRIDTAGGHARPAGDGHAVVVQRAVAGGDASELGVLGQLNRDAAIVGDCLDVVVAVRAGGCGSALDVQRLAQVPVNRSVGIAVALEVQAARGQVAIDLAELVFGSRLPGSDVSRIERLVGQAVNSTGVTIQRDRIA